MTTMQDVAKLAGTSSAVVSYVLNNGPRPVAGATRERVLAAVTQLNYRPNNAARSLRMGRSQLLGLMVPDSSTFFADLERRVEQEAYKRGYVVLVGNSMNDKDREAEYLALFREHQAAAVMLTVDPDSKLEHFGPTGIPVVLLDVPSPGLAVTSVVVDNRAAARAATEHLLEHGHHRIGFIGGDDGLPVADDRYEGWKDALEARGFSIDTSQRVQFKRFAGYEAMLRMLRAENPPTAVFVSSDQQAVGALRAAAELNVRIPEDLALMAFDDTDDCLYTYPSLSTVRQPLDAMIPRALDLVLNETTRGAMQHEVFPFELILRRSCGCSVDTRGERSHALSAT